MLRGDVRFFMARHVSRAAHSAGLTRPQARRVDERVAPYLGQVTWSRFEGLLEAAVIEADPEAAEHRRIAAEMARFVHTGRSSDYGTKTIYARAQAGDAIFFYAMCDRIAQILKLQGEVVVPEEFRDREMDVLRSEAIGILATPARAGALLGWAERRASTEAGRPAPLDTVPARAARPPATLHVHLSEESVRRQRRDPAWVEDVGPVTFEQAIDLLRHCHVTIKPVIDLTESPSVDRHEPSARIREIGELRHLVEVFPHGTLPSRRADQDHTVPYVPPDEGGPPGQTTPTNLPVDRTSSWEQE